MGSSIRDSVLGEAIAIAEKELVQLVEQLDSLRKRTSDAARRCKVAEKAEAHLEMELAKCQKEIDSLNAQHSYIEKQLDSLKVTSEPKKDELAKLKDLDNIIHDEEGELAKLSKCSAKLKEKEKHHGCGIKRSVHSNKRHIQKIRQASQHSCARDKHHGWFNTGLINVPYLH